MVPVLFDLSRQATSAFTAHFLGSLSQPDTHRSHDASQNSINVLPWLQEEKHAEPSLQAASALGYLILLLKEPLEQKVCLTFHFFSPPPPYPSLHIVSRCCRSVLRRGIVLVL